MVLVTISGLPGSGTSTLVELLSQNMGWSSINGGQIFRELATKKSMTLEEFGKLCEGDPSVDKQLDEELINRMNETPGPEIVESRLAGHWAASQKIECHKIWINVDETERAKRVAKREGSQLDEQLEKNKAREKVDAARFQSYYGIDINDMTPYSIVINSTNLTPHEVVQNVVNHIK